MCGINGFSFKDSSLIISMNKAISHRGPDDSGFFVSDSLSLGQVRLSILDLSVKGHQPQGIDSKNNLIYEDSKLKNADLVIIFNGEIYNFEAIRDELGGKFNSSSDTEVILRAYRKWGTDCVRHFNGMWSFVIFDKKNDLIFCSRDRLGVKPFYYFYDGKDFIFSSELKGLFAHKSKKFNRLDNISKDALELYFSMGFIPSPLTIFNDLHKLEGSHNLVFDLKTRSLSKSKYYEIPDFKPLHNKKKLINMSKELLLDATRLRMISDVPVGAFLSGGLDSSAVVGAMSKNTSLSNIHTCSIGFEGAYDETKYINLVKDYYKTKHHHYYFKEQDFEGLIDKYAKMYDEPFADYSGFPTYKVSELAQKHMTVVLTGDGGDEIFGGYNTHLMGARMELLRKIPRPIRGLFSKLPLKKNLNSLTSFYLLKEAFRLSLKKKEDFYAESLPEDSFKPKVYKDWSRRNLKYALSKGNNNLSEALRIYDLLNNTLQDNFLVKVDRASMNAPIEARSPFLDYRFIELSQKIPTKYKTTITNTKVIMRDVIKDLVPKEIIKRGKQGFHPPIDKWILNKKYEPKLKQGLATLKQLNKDVSEFYEQKVFKEKDSSKLYTNYKIRLFLFQKWCDVWIQEKK